MEAKFSKRLFAYIIDIMLLSILLLLVNVIVPKNNNIKSLNVELDTLNEQYLNDEISFNKYLNDYSNISYDLDKQNVIYTIVNIVFVIVYFIIVPYFFNGKTLGKKVLKIKVTKENKLTITGLLIRNLIINGLAYMFISLLLLYILPAYSYFITTTILSLIQLVLMIIILIGLIKNNDNLVIHDKLSHTKVVNL